MKKALLSITVLGLILFLGMTAANAQTPQNIAKTARASAVSVTMDNGNYGSGFFLLPGQIATSYHVVEGSSKGDVSPVLEKEQYPIVGISAIDKDNDLVILKVSGAEGIPLPIGNSGMVEVLDTIHVVGNPDGIEGTVTKDEITNLLGKYFLMSAPISPGSSGGAVLNDSGEVIGVSKGNIPGKERLNQNLNIVVPSKYLTPLVEKAKDNQGNLKPLSVDGVTGTHLTWTSSQYAFTVHNQRNDSIKNLRCRVTFKDNKGVICVDQFKVSYLLAGEVNRRSRLFVDMSRRIYDIDSSFVSSVGSRVTQLAKSYEIKILDFDIDHPSYNIIRIPLKGVTGGDFTWSEKVLYTEFSYSLQNYLSVDVKDVFSYVVFYDKEGNPIDESTESRNLEIPAMGTLKVEGWVGHDVKQLTKRVEFKIYRKEYKF